jgi:hypothetical protein
MMISGLVIGSAVAINDLCCWVLCIWVLAILPVRVTTSDGETVEGKLRRISAVGLMVDRDGETIELPFDRLAKLEPLAVEAASGRSFIVSLLDGSKIAARDLSLSDESLTIQPRRQQPLLVQVKDVKSIRFRGASTNTDPLWLGLLEREGRGDLLAIRRDGDRLDPYPGIVQGIEDGIVSFDMEGTSVQAPIEKLEGVVFGGNRSVAEDAPIRVRDVYGSTWAVDEILPSETDQPLHIALGGDIVHELPLTQIVSIRWSSGLQLLASSPAARKSFEPYFRSNVDPAILDGWFAPNSVGESDLMMRGESSIEFRVEEGFKTLAGSVQRVESVRQAGEVTVRILVDDQVKWEERIEGQQRLGFELSVDQARRVRIEVDCGEDGDLGDAVRISRPRLMK